jgi:hypothetical protein
MRKLIGALLAAALLAGPGIAHARIASWTLNSSDETSVELERAVGACASPDLVFVSIAFMPSGTTEYVDDEPLPEGQQYCYRVRVRNLVAESPWSEPAEWLEPKMPPLKGSWTFCAVEYKSCGFSGTREVRFGVDGAYVQRVLSDGTACTATVFGDPALGTPKHCDYR